MVTSCKFLHHYACLTINSSLLNSLWHNHNASKLCVLLYQKSLMVNLHFYSTKYITDELVFLSFLSSSSCFFFAMDELVFQNWSILKLYECIDSGVKVNNPKNVNLNKSVISRKIKIFPYYINSNQRIRTIKFTITLWSSNTNAFI